MKSLEAVLWIFYAVLFVAAYRLARHFLSQRADVTIRYQQLSDEEASLRADYALLMHETSKLKSSLNGVIALYDVTQQMTRSLERDTVVAVFQEALKRYLLVQECEFVAVEEARQDLKGYRAFPLSIGKQPVGTVMVKGLREKDDGAFNILFAQFQMAMKRVLLYQRVQSLATTDSLTGALSRRYWFDRCAEEFERARTFGLAFACLMIDVDHFKELNDTYGHLVGDAIVAAVAKVIKDNIRSIDLVGRYGGEEFALMLAETDAQSAFVVAERIRKAVADTPVQAYDEILRVTISIGIAQLDTETPDLAALVERADSALYQAKAQGRNRVCIAS